MNRAFENVPVEVLDRVLEFAKANGRTWRSKLRLLWTRGDDSGNLRNARNMIGPSRLDAITVEDLEQNLWNRVGLPVVERAKQEVLRDIATGRVPATVKTFAELHDYVDANYYGGAFEGDFDGSDKVVGFWNRVQSEVDAWLKAGRPS